MFRLKGFSRWKAPGLFVLASLSVTHGALAQSSHVADGKKGAETATAQDLYERAAALFEVGNLTEACPMFAKSHQLLADTVTLLALATCHREQGKNATAAAEFAAGKARAHAEGHVAREKYAADALRTLPPPSTVQIDVSPAVAALPDLVLRVDGKILPKADWNRPIPFDGGQHVIEAVAARGKPWRREFALPPDLGTFRDSVELIAEPEPRDVQATVPVPDPNPLEPEPWVHAPDAAKTSGWGALETTGVVVGGAGVASFAFAIYFFTEQQRLADTDVAAARQNGRKVDVANIVGGVLTATGITLFLVGRSQRLSAQSAPPVALSLGLPVSGGWGVAIRGSL